jgi:hypothetical protein
MMLLLRFKSIAALSLWERCTLFHCHSSWLADKDSRTLRLSGAERWSLPAHMADVATAVIVATIDMAIEVAWSDPWQRFHRGNRDEPVSPQGSNLASGTKRLAFMPIGALPHRPPLFANRLRR